MTSRVISVLFVRSLFCHLVCAIILLRPVCAQNEQKSAVAIRTSAAPEIDGLLTDTVWMKAPVTGDFVQLRPYNGRPAIQKSEVRFIYDDDALYVGAMHYDTAPDSIAIRLTRRDEFDSFDYFGIYLDPYNTGLSAYGFFVSTSNVQFDLKASSGEWDNEDVAWDAVFESAVSLNDSGWTVEMRIPYPALRFPKTEVQSWGINMFRYLARHNSNNSWSFIDNKQNGFLKFQGRLDGIASVNSPLRLSVVPYISSYLQNNSESSRWGSTIKGGMDLKYGINEGLTLDMILIPDFGQIQSDDIELNLTPFELFYSEKRQFFTEGTELFNRAEIFYSRRIGSEPSGYQEVSDSLKENEALIKNPLETQLLNATKITGRSPSGYGFGFLNAITLNTYAQIKDLNTNEIRKQLTQPLTNYNVSVVEKSLPHHSYVSLINTNYVRFADNYMSDVTAAEFRLNNAQETYGVFGKAALSQVYDGETSMLVGAYSLKTEKTRGKFRWMLIQDITPKRFNISDMGYMPRTNYIRNAFALSYRISEPTPRYLRSYNEIYVEHYCVHSPLVFNNLAIYMHKSYVWKNNWFTALDLQLDPWKARDYDEPRSAGHFVLLPAKATAQFTLTSDYAKSVYSEVSLGGLFSPQYNGQGLYFEVDPLFRLNTRLSINPGCDLARELNEIGYADQDDTHIWFGKRNVNTIENKLKVNYLFNNRMGISFRMRHYWRSVAYSTYYILESDGILREFAYPKNADKNFNAFTIDMAYTWNFAPGSELSLVWKDHLYYDNPNTAEGYFAEVENIFSQPQTNSISLKMLYYIDYHSIFKKSRR